MSKLIDAILIIGFLVILITAIVDNLPFLRQMLQIFLNNRFELF